MEANSSVQYIANCFYGSLTSRECIKYSISWRTEELKFCVDFSILNVVKIITDINILLTLEVCRDFEQFEYVVLVFGAVVV